MFFAIRSTIGDGGGVTEKHYNNKDEMLRLKLTPSLDSFPVRIDRMRSENILFFNRQELTVQAVFKNLANALKWRR